MWLSMPLLLCRSKSCAPLFDICVSVVRLAKCLRGISDITNSGGVIAVVDLFLGIIVLLLLGLFFLIREGFNKLGSNQVAIHEELVKLQNLAADFSDKSGEIRETLVDIKVRMRDNKFYTEKERKQIDEQIEYE
jgi:hypothetical protein